MKKLFGLKDESGEEYTLLVQQDLRTGEKHFDFERGRVEPKLEFNPGQWAVTVYGEVFRILSLKDGWVCWINNKGENVRSNPDYLKFATPQEIESHLIKIAKEKGFGSRTYYIDPNNRTKHHLGTDPKFEYIKSERTAFLTDGWGGAVYQDGKWAEIIPEKKKLPKTKAELYSFMVNFHPTLAEAGRVKKFLEDYED